MNIGQAIVTIRKKRGMTQKELAKRCGMSQNALCDLERSYSHPPMGTLRKLQAALGVPQSIIGLYSIEEHDFPENKRLLYRAMLEPFRKNLLDKED